MMRILHNLAFLCLTLIFGAGLLPQWASAAIVGPAEILDGDTLDIGMVRIRLHGIDAPENGQTCLQGDGARWPCGKRAAERLEELVGAGDLNCFGLSRDAYGRIISNCLIGEHDVAAILVREGLAWAYTKYSDDYLALEAVAREEGIGIWRAPTQTAWEFRENRWERAAAVAPRENCPIKGNINRKGERIYHTPWSRYYGRTQISTDDGEKWFCDEAEAEAAGWRPASGR